MLHPQPKVAFITGASRRIGASIANLFHAQGMNIIIHCNQSLLEATTLCHSLNQIRENSAKILQADLLATKKLPDLIAKAAAYWGRLDVVINNASRFYPTPIFDATEEMWDDLLISNLKAPFFISKAAAVYLQKTKGCIINITDIYAKQPLHLHSIYCISKAGLVMMTQSLAKELGPDIRVNAISPGIIIWPEGKSAFSEEMKQEMIKNTALKNFGDPTDIAKTALFLTLNAGYVTGQVIAVDGGQELF